MSMNLEAIRLIDVGLTEAIDWCVQSGQVESTELFGSDLSVHDLRSLAASLKKPESLDLEQWALALVIFRKYSEDQSGSCSLDVPELLMGLEGFRISALTDI